MRDDHKDILSRFLKIAILPRYSDRFIAKQASLSEFLDHKFAIGVDPSRVLNIPHAVSLRPLTLFSQLANKLPLVRVGRGASNRMTSVQEAMEEYCGQCVLLVFNNGQCAFFENEAGPDAVHWIIFANDSEAKRVKTVLQSLARPQND